MMSCNTPFLLSLHPERYFLARSAFFQREISYSTVGRSPWNFVSWRKILGPSPLEKKIRGSEHSKLGAISHNCELTSNILEMDGNIQNWKTKRSTEILLTLA